MHSNKLKLIFNFVNFFQMANFFVMLLGTLCPSAPVSFAPAGKHFTDKQIVFLLLKLFHGFRVKPSLSIYSRCLCYAKNECF